MIYVYKGHSKQFMLEWLRNHNIQGLSQMPVNVVKAVYYNIVSKLYPHLKSN